MTTQVQQDCPFCPEFLPGQEDVWNKVAPGMMIAGVPSCRECAIYSLKEPDEIEKIIGQMRARELPEGTGVDGFFGAIGAIALAAMDEVRGRELGDAGDPEWIGKTKLAGVCVLTQARVVQVELVRSGKLRAWRVQARRYAEQEVAGA